MNPKLDPIFKQLNALILGKQPLLVQIITCVLARGHILLNDVPGVGKPRWHMHWLLCWVWDTNGFSLPMICCQPIY